MIASRRLRRGAGIVVAWLLGSAIDPRRYEAWDRDGPPNGPAGFPEGNLQGCVWRDGLLAVDSAVTLRGGLAGWFGLASWLR